MTPPQFVGEAFVCAQPPANVTLFKNLESVATAPQMLFEEEMFNS